MSLEAFLRILLVVVFLGSAVGCGGDSSSQELSSQEKSPGADSTTALNEEYWLFAHVNSFTGNYKLTVNGFPVERELVNVTMGDQDIGAQLNVALIGEGNTASVIVEPYLQRSGDQLVVGDVDLEAWVSRERTDGSNVPLYELPGRGGKEGIAEVEVDSAYQQWKKRAVKRWERYLRWEKEWLKQYPDSSRTLTSKGGGALDSIEAWSDRNQLKVTTRFENESGPDFSPIFEEAPVITDTSRLKDYAVRLRNLLRSGNAEALYREIRPSISEETGWFKVTREGTREAALTEIREEWAAHYRTDFPRSKIRLRRWSGGRVWELYVIGPTGERRAFFSKGPSAAHLEVYVGEIDGKLRVVRLT
jgi:hypothetical protein